MVNGVRVPSEFSLTIAMCSRSRTKRKPSCSSARITRFLGASTGNLGIGFRDKSLQHGRFRFDCFRAKSFDVETDGRLAICQRLLTGVTLSNHDSLQAKWVSNVTVGMLLNDHF